MLFIISATSSRARALARPIALTCALAMSSSVWAQAVESTETSGTRDIFLATIASLVAQGIGSGLSDGISGTIKKWFAHKPKAKAAALAGGSPAAPSPSAPSPSAPAPDATVAQPGSPALYAGMAYEVHLVTADGGTRPVDPAHHVFHTGDRFQVLYRPTLPGRVRVSNVDSSGNESSIDDQDVAAAQLASLGPYEFVGSKGAEKLKLVMAPCSTPQLAAVTRSIVKTTVTSATTSTTAIADCNDPRTRGLHRKTRSIGRTDVQGATAFGLDALSKDELQSGLVDPRVIVIALQHK